MAEQDPKLKQMLQKAHTCDRAEPMYFAFAANGSESCGLVLSKKVASGTEITKAKAAAGGGRAFTGLCFNEGGSLKFESEGAPPGPAKTQIKKLVRDLGLSFKVAVLKSGEHESEDEEKQEEEVPSAPPPTQAPGDTAGFKDRLKKVSPVMQEAAQKAPQRKGELDKLAAQAVAAYKAGDIAAGMGHLDHVESVSKEILAGAAVPPAPPPRADAGAALPPAPSADAAAFKARLKAVSPVYQEATKQAPGHKAALDKLAVQAATAAKSGDYAAALTQLDNLETASKEALAPTAPPPPVVSEEATSFKARLKAVSPVYQDAAKQAPEQKSALDGLAGRAAAAAKAKNYTEALSLLDQLEAAAQQALKPQTPAVDGAAFKARMKEVLPVYQQAAQQAPEHKAELDKLAAQAAAAAKEKKFDEAIDLLDQLEARSKGAVRAEGAKAEIPVNKVKYAKHSQRYLQARARSYQELAKFQAAVLKDADTKADERYDQIQSAVGNLDKELAALDDRLVVGLKEIDSAQTPEDRTKALHAASVIVQDYRKSLDGNQLLLAMDAGTGYGTFDIYKSLAKSLDKLEKTLKA